MLARIRPVRTGPTDEPPVDALLDVDREYQAKVKANELRKIAPKRLLQRFSHEFQEALQHPLQFE